MTLKQVNKVKLIYKVIFRLRIQLNAALYSAIEIQLSCVFNAIFPFGRTGQQNGACFDETFLRILS